MRKAMLAGMMAGVALLASGSAAADVKAGVDAWQKGDFRAAVEQWRPLAVAGDADAEFNLAQAYKLGRGVPLDPALAESWFQKAAAQGHVQAQDNYGLALFQNDKKQEAVPWLEKSVARDEPRAELVLGTMLFNGDGAARDYPRAYALMTRASQQGLKAASETLTQMDQYVSPTDRERGTALAQQYAASAKSAQIASAGSGLRVGDTTPAADVPSPRAGARPSRAQAPAPRRGAPPPAGTTVDRAAPPREALADARARPDVSRGEGEVRWADQPHGDTPPPPRRTPPPPRAARESAPPAPARERPAPRAVAAAPRPTAGGGWRVQLGAFGESGNAQGLWNRVSGRFPGAGATYVKAGHVTRLQAGPYRTRAEAQRACASARVTCVVVAP